MAPRFRKVYIVCQNNQTFGDLIYAHIYKTKEHAEHACNRARMKADEEKEKMWNVNKPPAKYKVHAFYLVHEHMFKD